MNENINLCEILKGLEGIELYSTVYGTVTFLGFVNNQIKLLFHRKNAGDGNIYYEFNGHLNSTINDDEVTLFPSKTQRDWNKFQRLIPVNTPMVCWNNDNEYKEFVIRYYNGFHSGAHFVFDRGLKKIENADFQGSSAWEVMIPYDKFNPNDIEESLKYNIQK